MSLRQLPQIKAFDELAGLNWEPPADALNRWNALAPKAGPDDVATIDILDIIGLDIFTGGGVTSRRIQGALRAIGDRDVVVNINSPGGDAFEGIAIYNLLREHKARVSVRVLGLAASAASIIAMAGDDILIGRAAFLMIHNTWAVAVGNRHDMAKASADLGVFDLALADLYANRTGQEVKAVSKMMDTETWLSGQGAVDAGFATGLLDDDQIAARASVDTPAGDAARQLDQILARSNMPRNERAALIRNLQSGVSETPDPAMQTAGLSAALASLQGLETLLKS
jgi:ATP-dependent protease ClpP protease subunit